MKQAPALENRFVVELLTTLRQDHFSPRGWGSFLARAWDMSLETAREHATLARSWQKLTVFISLVTLAIWLICLLIEGSGSAFRLLPGLLFCVAWQQSDLFWHLGLHRSTPASPLLPQLGPALTLTWLRALAASFLLARLIGGLPTSSTLALLVFLAGVATDILDGQIARRTGMTSRLGQIGDGEADFCLYLALTLVLIQNHVLPPWLGLLMLTRFALPLLAAVASYFLLARPVRFGSTNLGRLAGLAQTLYFLLLLAPEQFTPLIRPIQLPLLTATIIFLLLAPLAQIALNIRPEQI